MGKYLASAATKLQSFETKSEGLLSLVTNLLDTNDTGSGCDPVTGQHSLSPHRSKQGDS